MSFYGSRIPHYITAKTEETLRTELVSIAAQLGQKLEVMSIYHNASRNVVTAWYFHDTKTQVPLPISEKPEKKVTKKKITKKAK